MQWGLASIAGLRHWVHINCDGLGTFIYVACGGKWILFRLHMLGEPDSTGYVDLFLDDFDPAMVVKTWDAEVVFLMTGT